MNLLSLKCGLQLLPVYHNAVVIHFTPDIDAEPELLLYVTDQCLVALAAKIFAKYYNNLLRNFSMTTVIRYRVELTL